MAQGSGLLARERIVAGPGFSRWLVPPAALAIHLCIGMAYGFSVFWKPMSQLVKGAPSCPNFMTELTAAACNWTVADVTHTFEIFIAVLGLSAAIFGSWVERAGPRKSGFTAALCWGLGLAVAGYGVQIHQLWLLYLGGGVLGGIGLGLGYITPVSTLIKWFPDRRGMATGFAIMGFGGGAMIGSPLAVLLMARYGVAGTLMILGGIYFVVMTVGAFGFRIAPSGWTPKGWTPSVKRSAMITDRHVHVNRVMRTPQFWLIWLVLGLNVTAGIAVLAMASPMLQEVFGGKLLGLEGHTVLSDPQKVAIAAAAAGLLGLLSLFNSLGRIFWASASDYLGRKNTYFVFFLLGIALYAALPTLGHLGLAAAFVISACVIMTMYGGGFATIPAYLADIFGTQMVGAIHGRLITAWSVAGVAGPMIITSLRQAQLAAHVPSNLVYDNTLYIMAGLLFVGLLCNALVRPVKDKHFMSDEELAKERALQHEATTGAAAQDAARGGAGAFLAGIIAWLAVGIPFGWGLYIALQKAAALF